MPGRLRHPRALLTTNLAEIAAQLTATPCPDKAAVKALWVDFTEEAIADGPASPQGTVRTTRKSGAAPLPKGRASRNRHCSTGSPA